MATVTVSIDVEAPVGEVWERLADLGVHSEWMADAESIAFSGPRRRGVGTRMKVETVVGPFRVHDLLEVTEWLEGHAIGVRHDGLVRGTGRFVVSPVAGATRVIWRERLTFPWRWGGPVTAYLARPLLAWIWRRNLARFREMVQRR